jgi:hypothetical protein
MINRFIYRFLEAEPLRLPGGGSNFHKGYTAANYLSPTKAPERTRGPCVAGSVPSPATQSRIDQTWAGNGWSHLSGTNHESRTTKTT